MTPAPSDRRLRSRPGWGGFFLCLVIGSSDLVEGFADSVADEV